MDVSHSTDAGRIEVWAAVNLLTLTNTPGEITRRGANHEKDSVIDLAWYNEAAIQASTFTGLTVDWKGSLSSDHAMLHVTGCTKQPSMQDNEETDLGFVVDPEKSKDWIKSFKTKSQYFPFSSIPTETEVEKEALQQPSQLTYTRPTRRLSASADRSTPKQHPGGMRPVP